MAGGRIDKLADLWVSRWRMRSRFAAVAGDQGLAPVTVVTGASSGIGLALARRFAAAGDNVLLVARTREPLEAAARDIEKHFRVTATPLPLDVTAKDCLARLDATLAERRLYCNVLVNAAGIGLAGPFHDSDEGHLAGLLGLNVTAVTALMRHYLPGMRVRGSGGVLNIASLGAFAPGPYQAAYYASKSYVLALTEAVAAEVAGEGVRVAVVAPGPVTGNFHENMGAGQAFYMKVLPMMGPEAVARAAYRGFRLGRRVIVPGVVNKVTGLAMRFAPHLIVLPIAGFLVRPRGAEKR